jgi:hypothetical protein
MSCRCTSCLRAKSNWYARIARRLSTTTLKKVLQWMIVESDRDQFIVTKRDNDDRVRDLDTP